MTSITAGSVAWSWTNGRATGQLPRHVDWFAHTHPPLADCVYMQVMGSLAVAPSTSVTIDAPALGKQPVLQVNGSLSFGRNASLVIVVSSTPVTGSHVCRRSLTHSGDLQRHTCSLIAGTNHSKWGHYGFTKRDVRLSGQRRYCIESWAALSPADIVRSPR